MKAFKFSHALRFSSGVILAGIISSPSIPAGAYYILRNTPLRCVL
jgi:hypothetical protein